MDKTETLLRELMGASGIPGHETEIRNLVRHYFESVGEVSPAISLSIERWYGTACRHSYGASPYLGTYPFPIRWHWQIIEYRDLLFVYFNRLYE